MYSNTKQDLTGTVYHDLTVLEGTTRPECLVRCVCGKAFMAHVTRMKAGQRKNCGCKRAENIRVVSRENALGLIVNGIECIDNLTEGVSRLWRCHCGNSFIAALGSIKTGNSKSCGCIRAPESLVCDECGKSFARAPKKRDAKRTACSRVCSAILRKKSKGIVGRQFGRLQVVAFLEERGKYNRPYWTCECSCGQRSHVLESHLKAGRTTSCGCQTREASSRTGIANCRRNNMGASSKRWAISVGGKDIQLRSAFELIYASHLQRHAIEFVYEPQVFAFTPSSRYLPDFYLPATNEWVEVKGHLTPSAASKHALFRELGHKLIVLRQGEIEAMLPDGQKLGAFYKEHRTLPIVA